MQEIPHKKMLLLHGWELGRGLTSCRVTTVQNKEDFLKMPLPGCLGALLSLHLVFLERTSEVVVVVVVVVVAAAVSVVTFDAAVAGVVSLAAPMRCIRILQRIREKGVFNNHYSSR